ncbi:MAG: SirA family protein [Alphaproteobacteria bacterium CG_4_10_14_0_2_um_filter_63_37]|nr:MAG: SirA family protein [Proteobacteria bacterium CG1_02_64_396]PJA24046.1 MAG: SirA family protein [Alphaproteobacteria bacterium CG_4_10_14_0_2_um_filter_63_37]
MTGTSELEQLDCRGLLCPLPVIRTQKRVKEMQPGSRLQILASDPGAAVDIPAWCRIHGHEVIEQQVDGRSVRIVVQIGGAG